MKSTDGFPSFFLYYHSWINFWSSVCKIFLKQQVKYWFYPVSSSLNELNLFSKLVIIIQTWSSFISWCIIKITDLQTLYRHKFYMQTISAVVQKVMWHAAIPHWNRKLYDHKHFPQLINDNENSNGQHLWSIYCMPCLLRSSL